MPSNTSNKKVSSAIDYLFLSLSFVRSFFLLVFSSLSLPLSPSRVLQVTDLDESNVVIY